MKGDFLFMVDVVERTSTLTCRDQIMLSIHSLVSHFQDREGHSRVPHDGANWELGVAGAVLVKESNVDQRRLDSV
jgi:hypothetical protein